ncbi:MAG: flagellar basal body rod protein FlgB [Oceanicaulis sp.]
MALDDINVLATLRQALGYHNARQRVIAENVANANTPGFTPGDISQSQFERLLNGQASAAAGGLRVTDPRHFTGGATGGSAAAYRTEQRPDTETTVNGNSVVIEEQMVRANENRMKFETALSLYQKSLNMIRTAARPAGQ